LFLGGPFFITSCVKADNWEDAVKRGFLSGLASFLILCAVAGIGRVISHADVSGVVLVLLGIALSLAAIWATNRAPPHKSKLYAVVGWLLGVFVTNVVALAVLFGVWALSG
jgi:hypothetical protein